jgi:hypothetical protein
MSRGESVGIRQSIRQGDWSTPTVVGTLLTAVGVVVAVAAWLYPKSPSDGSEDRGALPTPSPSRTGGETTTGATPSVSGGISSPRGDRYFSDIQPATGASAVKPGGPAGRHALVIPCGSGQSDDLSRIVRWNVPGDYVALKGEVSVSGRIDPESPTQVEWFVDGIRVFNTSTLTLRTPRAFSGEVDGRHNIRVEVTCDDPAATVTLLDARLTR